MSYFNAQKNSTDDLIREAEIDTREVENKYMDTKVGGGGNWETGIDTYTLLILCIKQITNENLPYSTGNTQCSVVTSMGKKSKREGINVNVQLTHFAVRQKLTQHCKATILQ